MYPKITLAGLTLTVACGLMLFARYSLDAIFAGSFSPNPEADYLSDNFAVLVIGCGALISSITTSLLRFRGRTVASRPWYRIAI